MSYLERLNAGTRLPKVLVVDDELQLQKALVDYLRCHNLNAIGVSCRAEALWALSTHKPDIILLDIKLGDDDGLELLRHLRIKSVLPVILMTGHLQDKSDRVVGLEMGADDYLLKPFDMRELVARVRANLRRREMDRTVSEWPNGHRYGFCGWVFDQRTRSLTGPNEQNINLTKSEFALLSTFVNAPFHLFTRQQLLQATRIHDEIVDRSIDVLILRLRRKLEIDPHVPRLIQTQRGVGYVFASEVSIQ
jgi:two-component system OmpR family response regulator